MSRQERWQLSGNAAAFYERYVRLIMDPWVRRVVDVAALRPAEHVLDVACGTGFVARLAADRIGADGRVVGVDLNAGMIEAARVASTANIGNIIEWQIGDAAALPFANAAFDVVLCQQGVELQRLVASAGFQNVRLWPTIEMTRLPLPAEFVPGHLAALPIAQEIARLAAERHATLVEDMTEALRGYVDRDQLTVPAGAHVVSADA